ncbi:MAG: RNHCP domain-containing protein [Clostridiales bacterium]|nr:RNHCP domain-containing protein [Clostridiales bacterium]MDO4349682.1 RNHCP domain-containing protein [Eubacteriales bacterium]MDY4009092.1 RNHCP domain-containing protein [Candidatus Limiplasma sp.]
MAYQKQKNIKNGAFVCAACGARVTPEGAGSAQRNHCPECLCSLHLDTQPGDRAAGCGGVMEAVGVWVRHKGEWALIHRCRICGCLHSNRIAADDNPIKLLALAVRPVANPPFPWELLGRMVEERLP